MGLKKYTIHHRDKDSIEAEEIFLDSDAVQSIEEKGKLEKPIKDRNFIILYGVVILILLSLFIRAGYLQVVKGDYYADLAQGNRLRIYEISAPRGIIYDRLGRALVYNRPNFDVDVNLVDFYGNEESVRQEIIKSLAELSAPLNPDAPIDDLVRGYTEAIERAYGQVGALTLISGLDWQTALVVEELATKWSGIRLEKNAIRQYLMGPYFAHVLGYTGLVTEDELDKEAGYFLNDLIGKTGLESEYEDILRGEAGQEQIEVDSMGKTVRLIGVKNSLPGRGVILHLDKDLQEVATNALEKAMVEIRKRGIKTRKAVGIAIDPRDGGVLAMVSLPSFDNNLFAQGINQTDLTALGSDPALPFLNRALSGQYPSGSIIKPLIGAGALQEGVIASNQSIDCRGVISIQNQYNPEIIYRFPDNKTHGLTDLKKAIAESCNVFFYTIGGGFGQFEGLGVGRIKSYLEMFGLGQLTNIDMPSEEAGLIPDEAWKKQVKPDEAWYLGDTYHLAIGQGDILVTPIQMAMAISAIANSGTLYQPQIVDKVVDIDKNIIDDISSNAVSSAFIDPGYLEVVRAGMRQAVSFGSARVLDSLNVEVAGKTGTAQFGNQGQTHAWFVGFAPYKNPEIALVILIEGGGEGHAAAVPAAKEILEWYYR